VSRVLVVGATGAQGGSVARHLLADGQFAVRALTRRPGSREAEALRQAGAEVVWGDLDDRPSLRTALKGVDAVFGVTSFWEHGVREAVHGRNLVNAVAGAEVEHLVLSTLPGPGKVTRGAIVSAHLDSKAALEAYARSLELPVTFVHVAFHYENLLGAFRARPNAAGALSFRWPLGGAPMPMVAVEDLGGILLPVFRDRATYIGRLITAIGDDRPVAEYAAVMSDALDCPIAYEPVTLEAFIAPAFRYADALAGMFEFVRTRAGDRQPLLTECHQLFPALQRFDTWVRRRRRDLLEVLHGPPARGAPPGAPLLQEL
jgi:uncharacterized protein YbjT (DUF2867 family)